MERREKLKKYLLDNGSQVFFSSLQADLIYFANFYGEGIYIFTDDKDMILTNGLCYEMAEKYSTTQEVIFTDSKLSKVLKTKFQRGKVFLVSENENISTFKILKRAGFKVSVRDTRCLRAQKELLEVKLIKKAYKILERAIKGALSVVREGVKELDIAAEISYRIRKNGAEGESFNPIVVFGEKTSVPHAVSGMRKLKKGDIILVDAGARFRGYCSDITRCFSYGNKNSEVRKYYRLLKEAFESALEALGSGEKRAKSIDASVRKVLKKAGVDKNFIHGLGHGIGLDVHELPRLGPESNDKLLDGMVFTIEPGVYFNGKYGLRLEDCVYLKSEPIVLTKLPRRIVEI